MQRKKKPCGKALFLDRDGVINEDTGYPHKPSHIVFRKGIFDLCQQAVALGYLIVVVTNQAGVATGRFTEKDVRALHKWMTAKFKSQKIPVAAFYYCPFHPEATLVEYRKDTPLRKPGPGMIEQAVRDLNIDVRRSLVLGDKPSDRIQYPGLRSAILKSEYSGEDFDVESLEQATRLL